MLRLVEDLLDTSAVISGHFELNHKRIYLGKLLCRRIRAADQRASEKGIRISHDIWDDLMLDIDKNRMIEVVDNILGNAIKFSPVGSEIQV
jgi:signal transduction histidine kinase